MRYVASWVSSDGLLVLSVETLSVFEAFRQGDDEPEAGGILLGFRRGIHFEVIQATPPSIHDMRTRASFVRKPFVHQEQAVAAWSASGGIVDHIGEWHTHCESRPTPSRVDTREWATLARRRCPPAPMVGIIVGTESLYVARMDQDGRAVSYVQVDNVLEPIPAGPSPFDSASG